MKTKVTQITMDHVLYLERYTEAPSMNALHLVDGTKMSCPRCTTILSAVGHVNKQLRMPL